MKRIRKQRSPYGEFLDQHDILQEQVVDITGLNRDTVSDVCNDPDKKPNRSTMTLLLGAIRVLTGKTKDKNDFWM